MAIYQKFLIPILIGLMYANPLYAIDDNQKFQNLRQSIKEQEIRLAEQKKERTQLVNDLKQQETFWSVDVQPQLNIVHVL
ncbi:hypothetical protein GASC598B02_000980, partial [Gilliamella apicola SCGC AB-598-B02]